MTRLKMISSINAMLSQSGNIGLTAHFVDADDETMDDEIEVRMAGVSISVSMQVGANYYGVGRLSYTNGEIDGVEHLYVGASFKAAAARLIAEVAKSR